MPELFSKLAYPHDFPIREKNTEPALWKVPMIRTRTIMKIQYSESHKRHQLSLAVISNKE